MRWYVYGSQPVNGIQLLKTLNLYITNKDEAETVFHLVSQGYKYATLTRQQLDITGHVISEQTTRFSEQPD